MRWFATVSALGIASTSLVGCGGSKSVDFFSGSGGTPGVSASNAGSPASAVASAGQSAAGSTSVGSSGSIGGSSIGGSDSGGAGSAGADGSVAGNTSGAAGAPSNGACTPIADIGSGVSFASAGPVCLRVTLDIAGWGCSNFDGRTVKVNGTTVACAELPLPSKVDGAYYFDISAGEHDYASMYWY